MNIFSIAAGFFLRTLLELTHNYVLVVVIFTIAVKLITMPIEKLGTKASKKYTDLKPKIEKIKNSGLDVHGVEEALTKLYEENNIKYINVLAKPLSMVLTMIMFIGFVNAIYMPLTYILRFSKDTIASVQGVFGNLSELQLMEAFDISKASSLQPEVVSKISTLISSMTIGDWNLSKVPSVKYMLWLPIIALAIRIIAMGLSAVRTLVYSKVDVNSLDNPDYFLSVKKGIKRSLITDLVFFALFCTLVFSLPASLSIYWITSSAMGIIMLLIDFCITYPKLKNEYYEKAGRP